MKMTTNRVLEIAVVAIGLAGVSAASAVVGPETGMHNKMMTQPGMMQHGMMTQPGMMQHWTMGRPGMMQQGMTGQQGMMQHGAMGRPGMMQHSMMGQPGMMRHGTVGGPGMMQQGMMGQPGMMQHRAMGRPGVKQHGMMSDPQAMADQQLTRLKTDLGITPEQKSAWEDFANALKGRAGLMESHRKLMMEKNEMPSFKERVAMMQGGSAQMQKMAEAAQAFHAALTPEQQAKARQIMGGHFY